MSTYTFDPINLGIIAPTSEGKTYVVTQVMKYFPKEDVWNIGSMSTKVLVRDRGILVNNNNQPIEEQIESLKQELDKCKDELKIREIKENLHFLKKDTRKLIDLKGIILIFLEPPQHELWTLLKPILSHDLPEIEFPYVDRTEHEGIITKKVVVRGWPACIFCSAKDESGWIIWPEIQSRFLITSPNMNSQKYFESNILIAQRKGLPNQIQQHIIISDKEVEMAKYCIQTIKKRINNLFLFNQADYSHNTNSVWIPYCEHLGTALQSNKGIDNRATNRIFSLLNIIPLAKIHQRHSMLYGSEKLVIATLEDLSETLYITQNITGIPTHKIHFYKEIFLKLYNTKKESDKKGEKEEERIAVTTSQLCDYFKSEYGRTISSNNLKQTFLNELINSGYVDEEESLIDKRQKIYFPLIQMNDERISNCNILTGMDNLFQHSPIIPPKNFDTIPENWLKLEYLKLFKYPLELAKILFVDKDGNQICFCKLIKEYEIKGDEKRVDLNGFFYNAENKTNRNEIFGNIEFLGIYG